MTWHSLYTASGISPLNSIALRTVRDSPIEPLQAVAPLERAVASVVVTLLVSAVVLGFLQHYGERAVTVCRRSPLISFCIGLPILAIVGVLAGVGALIIDTSIGALLGVLFVSLGTTVIPAATAIGLVAIGQSIAAHAGSDRLWIGILLGSLVGGVAAVSVPIGLAVGTIAGAVGAGSIVRIFVNASGPTPADERTVPPANRI